MIRLFFFLSCVFTLNLNSQTLNLNNSIFENQLRRSQLENTFESKISFTIRPFHLGKNGINLNDSIKNDFYPTNNIYFLNNKAVLKILPIDNILNYTSHHPYNRNNGAMIPNKGYQHLISAGIYLEIGPLSIQFKPELVYAENKEFDGFWEGHYDYVWARKYLKWNNIDLPERFGDKSINKKTFGQSSIRLNHKGISFGISSENIWWGPSMRNSIMLSNHAQGFHHVTFNSLKPINTPIGSFEWQLVTGRLEPSGHLPPSINREYNGTLLYVPKENEIEEQNDWRFFQGYILTYSPKWIDGLSLGLMRWSQMYGAMFEGRYSWMTKEYGRIGYLPIFNNFFRSNDKVEAYESNTDQAAGIFFRWLWKDSKAELYGEFNHNDSKANLRDLLLDSDHSRAVTFGINKIFDSKKTNKSYQFMWEWTQLEQTASRIIRNAGSWYDHGRVYHGYTHYGEVLGAGIGPGSNSHYISLSSIKNNEKLGFAVEIIDQDNDFYYLAFENSKDFRRYWKDYNFHVFLEKKIKNIWTTLNFVYSRSLNYQWELTDESKLPYYRNGRDVNNIHIDLKLVIPIKF